ncbi:uncharacterized protein LOC141903531 isoform X2 [Tubulanus polymorphus]|uniref:uncharacterized protein LOC141903531 isoform X2 n=1 Tax=Tubulanus polymorphus TaxID=672921 RepID=UPI003DA1F2AE
MRELRIIIHRVLLICLCFPGVYGMEDVTGIIIGCSVGGSVFIAILIFITYYFCIEDSNRKLGTSTKSKMKYRRKKPVPMTTRPYTHTFSIDRRVLERPVSAPSIAQNQNRYPSLHTYQPRIWMTSLDRADNTRRNGLDSGRTAADSFKTASLDRLDPERNRAFSDPTFYNDYQKKNPLFMPNDDTHSKVYSFTKDYSEDTVDNNKTWKTDELATSEKSDSGFGRSSASIKHIRIATELSSPTYSTLEDLDLPPEIHHHQEVTQRHEDPEHALYAVPSFKKRPPPLPPRSDEGDDYPPPPQASSPTHSENISVNILATATTNPADKDSRTRERTLSVVTSTSDYTRQGKEVTSSAFQFLEDYATSEKDESNNTVISEVIVHRPADGTPG